MTTNTAPLAVVNPVRALQIIEHTLRNGGHTEFAGPAARYIIGQGGAGFTCTVGLLQRASAEDVSVPSSLLVKLAVLRAYWVEQGYQTVGTWVDTESSTIPEYRTVYVDPGNATDDLDEALRLGKERGELAIWDTLECVEIRL